MGTCSALPALSRLALWPRTIRRRLRPWERPPSTSHRASAPVVRALSVAPPSRLPPRSSLVERWRGDMPCPPPPDAGRRMKAPAPRSHILKRSPAAALWRLSLTRREHLCAPPRLLDSSVPGLAARPPAGNDASEANLEVPPCPCWATPRVAAWVETPGSPLRGVPRRGLPPGSRTTSRAQVASAAVRPLALHGRLVPLPGHCGNTTRMRCATFLSRPPSEAAGVIGDERNMISCSLSDQRSRPTEVAYAGSLSRSARPAR